MPVNDMLPVLSAQEVSDMEREREQAAQEADKALDNLVTSLSAHIERKWADAKSAKENVETELLASLRDRRGEYDPQKLAEIKSAEQPEIFMNVTETKCRNAVAWIKDILIQPGVRIFSIDPTPVPELPEEITAKIQEAVVMQFLNDAVSQAQQTGMVMSSDQLRAMMIEQAEAIKTRVHQVIIEKSKAMGEDIAEQIHDDFAEGGFYKALEQMIDDIAGFKGGIMKGPIFRKVKVKRTVQDPQTGKLSRVIEEKIKPQYDRRSPFSIFPAPRSTDIDDGYLFDVVMLQPRQLYSLIGVDGYDEDEIRAVLREFKDGALRTNWLELSLEAMEGLGEEYKDSQSSTYPQEKIYCLELWDDINGQMLLDWGMSNTDIPDPDNDYPVCIWKIGQHVIKAMLQYDLLGRKPYYTTSFQTDNDSFWGRGIPEIIRDTQQVCNAAARSILANIGMGALPQVDLNIDRLEPGASRKIWPGRVWPTTDELMAAGSKALAFYQPQMVTEQLIRVYQEFSKIADDHSGVPAYAHGNTEVGGAGNTSSGLSQLISMAARGIKSVVRNIDIDVITKALERHYDYILDNMDIFGLIGDYKCVAKGTTALLEKEQQAVRQTEFLNMSANPIDIQLIGMEARRKMLLDVAKKLGITIDDSKVPIFNNPMAGQPQLGGPPPPAPATLDQAGAPVVGQDNRQFNPETPPAQVSTPGNAGGAVGYA